MMKRNVNILVLFITILFQVSCGNKENDKDLTVIENSAVCNCNDVFLDADYGYFYTKKREEPFTGLCEAYFPDGTVAIKKIYENGRLQGPYVEFYENGNIKSNWNFLNGRQHGEYKGYEVNGDLKYHSIFYKGDLDTTIYP